MRFPKGYVALRKVNTGKSQSVGFTVPKHIADHLTAIVGDLFECELTDDGVLFRWVGKPEQEVAEPVVLPYWLANEAAKSEKKSSTETST